MMESLSLVSLPTVFYISHITQAKMPEILEEDEDIAETPTELPFPPITKQHILHCSYHSWHPKYAPHHAT